jgi:hypothetical protein
MYGIFQKGRFLTLKNILKICFEARYQWLTPIILTPWEAEIGRIEVRGRFG